MIYSPFRLGYNMAMSLRTERCQQKSGTFERLWCRCHVNVKAVIDDLSK